jgi:hypothetical protein
MTAAEQSGRQVPGAAVPGSRTAEGSLGKRVGPRRPALPARAWSNGPPEAGPSHRIRTMVTGSPPRGRLSGALTNAGAGDAPVDWPSPNWHAIASRSVVTSSLLCWKNSPGTNVSFCSNSCVLSLGLTSRYENRSATSLVGSSSDLI